MWAVHLCYAEMVKVKRAVPLCGAVGGVLISLSVATEPIGG